MPRKKYVLRNGLLVALTLVLVGAASAYSPVLAWAPNPPAENVVDYIVGVGTSHGAQDVGEQATGGATTFTWVGLPLGGVYYFSVRAQDDLGLLSDWQINGDDGNPVMIDLIPPSLPTGLERPIVTVDLVAGTVTVEWR
jgi:hypothetical protein